MEAGGFVSKNRQLGKPGLAHDRQKGGELTVRLTEVL
jgi:hypothetical protein